MSTSSTDVVRSADTFDDAALASITSFDDALRIIADAGIPAESIADYGTGFVLTEKSKLVGVPHIILQWRFNEGDYGVFVSVEAVTKNGDKVVYNDGSTGIRAQLQDVTARRHANASAHPTAVLAVPGGLTVTDYYYNAKTGEARTRRPDDAPASEWTAAHTYYLAN